MKLARKQVWFMDPFAWPTRRRLLFLASGNSVHLEETALLIEGNQLRFTMPVVDRFFRRALCAWTQVTVPYSRIVQHQYQQFRIARWLLTILFFIPAFIFIGAGSASSSSDAVVVVMLGIVFAVIALVAALFVHFRILVPRNFLWFRQADGALALVTFRIPNAKKQKEFSETLAGYRAATLADVEPVAAGVDGPSGWPALILSSIVCVQLLALWWPDIERHGPIQALMIKIQTAPDLFLAQVTGTLSLALLAWLATLPRHFVLRWITVASLALRGLAPLLAFFVLIRPSTALVFEGVAWLGLALLLTLVSVGSSRKEKP